MNWRAKSVEEAGSEYGLSFCEGQDVVKRPSKHRFARIAFISGALGAACCAFVGSSGGIDTWKHPALAILAFVLSLVVPVLVVVVVYKVRRHMWLAEHNKRARG